MTLKSDQEPAMIALQREVREELWQEVIEIMNRVKDSRNKTEHNDNLRRGSNSRVSHKAMGVLSGPSKKFSTRFENWKCN